MEAVLFLIKKNKNGYQHMDFPSGPYLSNDHALPLNFSNKNTSV